MWLSQEDFSKIATTTDSCCEILRHISQAWKTVEYHFGLFQMLSAEVLAFLQEKKDRPNAQDLNIGQQPLSINNLGVQPAVSEDYYPGSTEQNDISMLQQSSHQLDSMTWDLSFGDLPTDNFMVLDADLDGFFGLSSFVPETATDYQD